MSGLFSTAARMPLLARPLVQGLAQAQQGADHSSNGGGDAGGAADTSQAAAGGRQDFPEKRKTMFCYKAPSDSLLIQARPRPAAAAPNSKNTNTLAAAPW